MKKKKVKIMKDVKNNNTPDSDLQFNVIKSLEQEKRINPKKVFQQYTPPKNKIKVKK